MILELTFQLSMVLAAIGWVLLMVAIAKAMNYFRMFDEFKARNDSELAAINNHLRKENEYLGSVLLEARRTNRILETISAEYWGKPEIEDLNYADDGISRELHHEEEMLAKTEEETKKVKKPLPPTRKRPVVEIIPKMDEN